MDSSKKGVAVWAILAGVGLSAPVGLDGQGIAMPELTPSTTLEARCRRGDPSRSSAGWIRVREALAHPDEELWEPVLASLQDSLAARVAQGAELETRYLLAAVLGARSEVASGRSRLEWAGAMRVEAEAILAREPSHAGAHHLMGRLHAAVQRLGALKRFVARHLFGAEALSGASWGSARLHLEYAEARAPCAPEHHFELARLYADLGDPRRAHRELAHVLELIQGRDDRAGVAAKVEALAEELLEPATAREGADL